MVIIRSALRIPGCAPGSSELSYRQVAARDYRVPEMSLFAAQSLTAA
jgi:hypothetical protein